MSAYRYLVFPLEKQPSVGEVAELHDYSAVLAGRFAFGTDRKTGTLVVAFDRSAFDHARQTHEGFESLIHRWKLSGCELVEHLGFVKDSSALQPTHASHWHPDQEPKARRGAPNCQDIVDAKEEAAREALARSLLGVDETLERFELIHRLGGWVLAALFALTTLGTLLVGAYVYHRLQEPDVERREDTVKRVVEDPMQETLLGEEELVEE